jgi:hypothetical protein
MKLKRFIPIASGVLVLGVVLFFVIKSFSPFSKESYLEKYEAFMDKVAEERDTYSDEDWKEIDEEYEQFNEEWYKKFEDELTWKEDLTLTKYSAQYNFYRYSPL